MRFSDLGAFSELEIALSGVVMSKAAHI